MLSELRPVCSATGPAALAMLILPLLFAAPRATSWGTDGHLLAGQAAATDLPAEMPAFFRNARDQLSYLNYEPDRWRDGRLVEMNQAFQYDHYISLERVDAAALEAPNRFQYLLIVGRGGLEVPESAGILPFRILELYERLLVQFRLWRTTSDPAARAWIEQRAIQDAGILGHYVTDAANPHHTTIHGNGWATGQPNPRGFTSERTFHRRFESDFVGARITLSDLTGGLRQPRLLEDARAATFQHIRESHARLDRLYELEQVEAFGANTSAADHHSFAVERLAAGVDMLRSLWWTAWVRSGEP